MKPFIPQETKDKLYEVSEYPYNRKGISALKWCNKRAKSLFEEFQKKNREQVQFAQCNGDFWITNDKFENKRYRKLNEALDITSNPVCLGASEDSPDYRYECKIIERFPELCELWYIAYTLDASCGRIGVTLK